MIGQAHDLTHFHRTDRTDCGADRVRSLIHCEQKDLPLGSGLQSARRRDPNRSILPYRCAQKGIYRIGGHVRGRPRGVLLPCYEQENTPKPSLTYGKKMMREKH